MTIQEQLDSIKPGLDLGVPGLDATQFDMQFKDFKQATQHKVFGCFNDVGTGKTIISLLYLANNFVNGVKTVVVIPSSLIAQYYRSLEAVSGLGWSICLLPTNGKKRDELINSWRSVPDVVVMTPDSLCKSAGILRTKGFKSLVIDEAHMIISLQNKIRMIVVGLIRYCEYTALLLTGTPHNAELESAYGMISVLNPDAYENFDDFANQHINYKRFMLGGIERKIVEGYRSVEKMKMNLFARSSRRRSSDVLTLAKPTIIEHRVTLSREHNKAISTLITDWLDTFDQNPEWLENSQKVKQQALMRVTNPPVRDPRFSEPVDSLKGLVESINPRENKVIIFCYYQRTVEYLATLFNEYNPALVYGGSDSGKASELFKTDPTCRIMIANYLAGGAGHNWQFCNHTVMYEPIADVKWINQAIGRTQRAGQTKPVIVYYMTYSVEIMKKIAAKTFVRAELSKELLGDQTSILDYFKKKGVNEIDADV
jgi:SNF2 family DNA or RNA helicase